MEGNSGGNSIEVTMEDVKAEHVTIQCGDLPEVKTEKDGSNEYCTLYAFEYDELSTLKAKDLVATGCHNVSELKNEGNATNQQDDLPGNKTDGNGISQQDDFHRFKTEDNVAAQQDKSVVAKRECDESRPTSCTSGQLSLAPKTIKSDLSTDSENRAVLGNSAENGETSSITHQSSLTNKKKIYDCPACEYKSELKEDLIIHQSTHIRANRFECRCCGRRFRKEGSLRRHILIHSRGKPLACERCNYRCRTSLTLEKHNMRLHSKDKLFACKQCNYRSARAGNLKNHMMIHTGERPFLCEHCNYASRKAVTVRIHMMIHTGEKPLTCRHCEYRCRSTAKLKNHMKSHELENHYMRVHTGEKPFKCLHCDYRCSTVNRLKQHRLIHTPEKRFACEHCDYRTNTRYTLDAHIRTHTGEKLFACAHCAYKSNRRFHLKAHMGIHTGNKPFACEHCDYRSTRADALRSHMKTHLRKMPDYLRTSSGSNVKVDIMCNRTEEKPVARKDCDSKRMKANSLKRRKISHSRTGENYTFVCEHCEFRHKTAGGLRKHWATHTIAELFDSRRSDESVG